MRNLPLRSIIFASYSVVMATLVLIGIKDFTIWEQVVYYWRLDVSLFALLGSASSHALRYAIVYPVFVVSDWLGVHYNLIFSYAMIAGFTFTLFLVASSAERVTGQRRLGNLPALVMALPIFALFMAMNGRGGVAFLGYALVLKVLLDMHYTHRFRLGTAAGLTMGVLLCSVSSGTFTSAILAILVAVGYEVVDYLARRNWRYVSKAMLVLLIATAVLLVAMSGFIAAGVVKNLQYYGGGLEGAVNMLNHGPGRVIMPLVTAVGVVPLLVGGALAGLGGLVVLSRLPMPFLILLIASAVAIGIFGYFTLALALVPLILYGFGLWKWFAPLPLDTGARPVGP